MDLHTDSIEVGRGDSVGIPGREIPGAHHGEACILAAGDQPLLADFNLKSKTQVAQRCAMIDVVGVVRSRFYKGKVQKMTREQKGKSPATFVGRTFL